MSQPETANITRDSIVSLISIHLYMGKVIVKYLQRMLPERASEKAELHFDMCQPINTGYTAYNCEG